MDRMMGFKYGSKLGAILLLSCATIACNKIKCDEEAPKLTYDTLMLSQGLDSLIFQTIFEDCQGDIGYVGKVDTNTIRSVRTHLFEFIDDEWVRWYPDNLSDTVLFYSVIPGSSKNKEGWLLKGTLIQKFGLSNLKQNSDTIRFETYVLDQAENRSNKVTSPAFIFPSEQ